jgi:hypothetical protein
MEICRSIAPSQYTISWYRPLVPDDTLCDYNEPSKAPSHSLHGTAFAVPPALHNRIVIVSAVNEALKNNKERNNNMALKTTIGEIHKQRGATPPAPTHFYHPWMKKIYGIDLKPHFEKVFERESTLRRKAKRKRSRTFVPFHGEEGRWESK